MKKTKIRKITAGLALAMCITASAPAVVPQLYATIVAEAASNQLNHTSLTMMKGCTEKLKVSNNSKKVSWSSSNKKIVSVSSNGKLKARKAGKATITAKVGRKTYTCKVTVTNRKKNVAELNQMIQYTDPIPVALPILPESEPIQ